MKHALLCLKSLKDALAHKVKGSSTVHHVLDELDLGHMAVVEREGQSCSHGLLVLPYPMSEALQLWYLALIDLS